MSMEISQMTTRESFKPINLRNIKTIRRGTKNVAIHKREINNVTIKIIAFVETKNDLDQI